jgi:phosphatidylglycerophosphatase A
VNEDKTTLFFAQGFGLGRIPLAPGTFGSLGGFIWFAAIVSNKSFIVFLLTLLLACFVSVTFCGRAEQILGKKDPGCVVLDEIIAIPFCFLPWVFSQWMWWDYAMPPVATFFTGKGLIATVLIFIGFRIFDIWKPWPIRRLQNLPGGWGVTVDDVVAAIYVALITIPFLGLLRS